ERNNITPFYLGVRLTKGLREAGHCCTNHGELLKGGGLMKFTSQERRGLHTVEKGLHHVAGLENVLQVEVLTPHTALVRWPKYAHEWPASGRPWGLNRPCAPRGLQVRVAFWQGS